MDGNGGRQDIERREDHLDRKRGREEDEPGGDEPEHKRVGVEGDGEQDEEIEQELPEGEVLAIEFMSGRGGGRRRAGDGMMR